MYVEIENRKPALKCAEHAHVHKSVLPDTQDMDNELTRGCPQYRHVQPPMLVNEGEPEIDTELIDSIKSRVMRDSVPRQGATEVMRRACKAISFYLEGEHEADAMFLGGRAWLSRVSVQPYNKIDK
ncbi:hypothetical protein CBL_09408 [Carabus blaptoides fortunei]